jgi:hypothetical protein
MTTTTHRGGIEIGHGNHMSHVMAEIEQQTSTRDEEECWTTAAFLVPSVVLRMPRWKARARDWPGFPLQS